MSHDLLRTSILVLLCGCASLHSVSVTPVPAEPGKEVQAVVESPWIVLGIRQDHAYLDDLVGDLRYLCKDGRVTGILTRHEQVYYVVVSKVRVTATGRCLQ